MTIDPAIEIRRDLAEMEANRAHLDPALYDVLHASLESDLAELAPAPVPEPPRRVLAVNIHAVPPPPVLPPPTPAPQAEHPMTKINLHPSDPAARVAHLVETIQAAAKKGEKCYWAQQDIRKICAANGLEVPACAEKLGHAQKPAAKPIVRTGARRLPIAQPRPPRPEALSRPLETALELGRAIERHTTTSTNRSDVQTHLRGIRRQVWMLMADLENLTDADLRDLASELEVLESATHQAHQLALHASEPVRA